MNRAIISQRITSILAEIERLNNALYAMNTTDIQRYPDNYEVLSTDAALRAERITCRLRHLIYATTSIKKEEYLRSAETMQGIEIHEHGGILEIKLPCLLPKRRQRQSTEFLLDPFTVHDVTLEYPGQIIKLSAYDKPASLGVTITKRGNAQVMAGQSMRYDLTVANTSNVPLESFFWHDKIPYDVARPTTLTTGTYSARLNYRVLYKTNYNTSYQVLASNLLTSNNYSFSLNAIPMQAGEVVTDIYFDFGKVPVGFQSVVNPTLSVMVNGNAVNGYQMVNRADVGGKYQGTWQTATASWVTIIRRLWNTPTLPKTGY